MKVKPLEVDDEGHNQVHLGPEIARLRDLGRIEDYPAEAFASMAQRLADWAPVARRFG